MNGNYLRKFILSAEKVANYPNVAMDVSEKSKLAPTLVNKELKGVFDSLDADNDGMITSQELVAAMRLLGDPSKEEITNALDKVDAKSGQLVRFNEFLNVASNMALPAACDTRDEILEAFRTIDHGRTGFIAIDDLRHSLRDLDVGMTVEDIEEVIFYADAEGTGWIDYESFVCFLFAAK